MNSLKSLKLQTRKYNDIINSRNTPLSLLEIEQNRIKEKQHPLITARTKTSYIYNCHGMTFASRRTCIYGSAEVRKILREDDYEEVDANKVLPGDVVAYYDTNNVDIEHTGVVVETMRSKGILNAPLICSKWGKGGEFIHSLADCPYNIGSIKFYRVTK
jgi:hypothetical protein